MHAIIAIWLPNQQAKKLEFTFESEEMEQDEKLAAPNHGARPTKPLWKQKKKLQYSEKC